MVLQIANISKGSPELFGLLKQAYEEVYLPAFPVESERESLEKFMRGIRGEIPKVSIVVNVLGENLQDPEKRVIKGVSVAYYYEVQNTGLLAYNAVAPQHREKGLGKIMVESRIKSLKQLAAARGKKLGGVFIEVNDPSKVSRDEDVMDPLRRVAIFKEWGARQVPRDYIQPPVNKGDDYYNDKMLLMNYPVEGKYCDKEGVLQFLRAIYREGRSEMVADNDHFFSKMKKQMEACKMPEEKENHAPGYKMGRPPFKFCSGM